VTDAALAQAPPARDFTSIVRLDGVQKYFGAIHALRDINIAVGRNETVGLIGDNGAGKSTLIKVMTGVIAPTSGRNDDILFSVDHVGGWSCVTREG